MNRVAEVSSFGFHHVYPCPIAAGSSDSFASVDVSADGGVTLQTLDYTDIRTAGGYSGVDSAKWSIGGVSAPLAGDTLTLSGQPGSTLAGFIITDKPVITDSYPLVTTALVGDFFTLTSGAIGVGTISYQWRRGGVNIPGATSAAYTVASGTAADSGSYDVVVTSSAFPASPVTSGAFTVSVNSSQEWKGNVSSVWDTLTANWLRGGAAGAYINGLVSRFTDAGTSKNVVLNSSVTPGTLDFPGDLDYTITGSGSVVSSGGITKAGGAHVTLNVPVSLAGSISIGGGVLEFGNSGALGTGGTYSGDIMNAGELVFNGSAARTLGGVLSGPGALTKSGSAALTLTGAGTWTGLTTVNEGSVEVQAKAADNPYAIMPGAILKIGYSTAGAYASTKMDISGSGVSNPSGLYLKGGTSYNVSGGLTLADGPSTIRQYGEGLAGIGIFDINSTGLACNAEASGSVIDANIQLVQRGYGMAMRIDSGDQNATGDLIVNGPLNIHNAGYGLVKRGDGSLRLNGTATAENEALRIDAGTVITGAANAIGVNADLGLTNAGSTLVLNGTSQAIKKITGAGRVIGGSATSATLTVSPDVDANDTVPDVSFSGALGGTGTNENNFGLVKSGPNVLTLNGTDTYSGPTSVNGGTLISRSLANSTVSVGAAGKWVGSGSVAGLSVASGGIFSPDGPPAVNNQLVRTVLTTPSNAVVAVSTTGDFQELNNATGTVVPANTTYVYTGQIYLPGAADTVYYFGENFDDTIVLTIDGTPVLTANAWNVIGSGSFTSPGPGWYSILLSAGQGGGGVGPVSTSNWGPGKGVGFTATEPADPSDGDSYQAFTLANLSAAGILLRSDSGQIATSGNAKVAGTYLCDITGAGGDKLSVTGNLDLTGATLDVNVSGSPSGTYVIASYTGTLTGTFGTTLDLPSGYTVNYNTAAKQVELVSGGATGFTAWIAGYTVSDASPNGDPDHDGVSNAFEFVLGGNPSVPGDVALPEPENVTVNLGNGSIDYMKLAFRRQDIALYSAPVVQYSTTLTGTWSTAVNGQSGVVVKVTDNVSAGVDLVEVYLPHSLATGGRLFARLKATP